MIQHKTISRLILVVAVLLAAFFRFWQLNTLPPGLYHDEAYNGLDALSLTEGATFPIFYEGWELYSQDAHAERAPTETRFPVFFEGNYGREPLHVYLMALSISLFGVTPFAVRAVPAISGVIAVITTYFAASVLLREGNRARSDGGKDTLSPHRRVALSLYRLYYAPAFAALALAILFPAIHFSRFGIRAMVFVPIETLTVALFWLGIDTLQARSEGTLPSQSPNSTISQSFPRRIARSPAFYFITAGFFLGLGIYTYAAARLFPLLFILFIPLWLWHSKRWQSYWKYAAMMAGMSILTALPLLLFFYRYPYFFIFRIAFVSNKGTGTVDGRPLLTWFFNIGRVIRGLFWQGENHLRHNLPGRPYLDVIQSGLFGLGVGAYFYRWYRIRPIFLGLWLGVMLLPSILSGDAPHFGRLTGAAPVVAILVGIGAAWVVGIRDWRLGARGWGLGTGGRGLETGDRSTSTQSANKTQNSSLNYQHPITNVQLLTIILLLFLASSFITYRDYFNRYANHPELETDFYLADWELGQYGAQQDDETVLYLTPTQEEMATIYFGLADPERIQSYAGGEGLVPLGRPDETAVYFIRPIGDNKALTQLNDLSQTPVEWVELENVWAVNGQFSPDSFRGYQASDHLWDDKIRLTQFNVNQSDTQISVSLLWETVSEMERPYTAFVHLLDADGNVAAQLDRPPAGYPTTDWLVNEGIHDVYTVNLPPDLLAGTYQLQTGFYYLPTLELLGTPVQLMEIEVGQ
ncbi:MAG: hypothetical protein AAF490_21345 [Chloroflexota bacterium]